MNKEIMRSIEKRLGYRFKDSALLVAALTHPSYRHETVSEMQDNQRLEFLGDAALGLASAAVLYERFPAMDEGALTHLRSRFTNGATLARIGRDLALGDCLQLGRGEEASGGRKRSSNLTDAVEAVIGAVYLDGGYRAVSRLFLHLWADDLTETAVTDHDDNPKGRLQEWCQQRWKLSPTYKITEAVGPPHARQYTTTVYIKDEPYGVGIGPNKRTAEMEAARQALTRLEQENPR